MKPQEIQVGKTYYHLKTQKIKRSGKTQHQLLKYFVVGKNEEGVQASCNGSSVSIYKAQSVGKWVKDKPIIPELNGTK